MVSKSRVYISQLDADRLRALVCRRSPDDNVQAEVLTILQDLLDSAVVVDALPAGTVALWSKVLLISMESGRKSAYTLVLPSQADISEGRISILAPLGMAILGRNVGEIFQFSAPGGTKKIRLEEVWPRPANGQVSSAPATAARLCRPKHASKTSRMHPTPLPSADNGALRSIARN